MQTELVGEELLPRRQRDAIIREYGLIVAGIVDQIVKKRADEVIAAYERQLASLSALLRDITRTNELLTPTQAAMFLGISLTTLNRRVTDGAIPKPVRVSDRRIGFRVADLEPIIAAKIANRT